MSSGRPAHPGPVPAAVSLVAGSRPIIPVWRNEAGGLTYQIGVGPDRRFIKWTPPSSEIDLGLEVIRLSWAGHYIAVPEVLDQGRDQHGSWFVSRPLPGNCAVADRWKAEPRLAVIGIGEGLRAMHESLPVSTCPFTWSAADRVAAAHRRAAAGRIDPDRWHPTHRPLGLAAALTRLADIPPIDRLVVCHGDACAPNTLLDDHGRWCGHVDLGALGTADRWADLAIATWSTQWNYGPGWELLLLAAYGIEPDQDRTAFYRLLWDLGPLNQNECPNGLR